MELKYIFFSDLELHSTQDQLGFINGKISDKLQRKKIYCTEYKFYDKVGKKPRSLLIYLLHDSA